MAGVCLCCRTGAHDFTGPTVPCVSWVLCWCQICQELCQICARVMVDVMPEQEQQACRQKAEHISRGHQHICQAAITWQVVAYWLA